MRLSAARLLALAAAVLVPGSSTAVAEEAIKAGEQRELKQNDPCAAFGAGYFQLAGTETCIKVGGGVRFDVGIGDLGDGRSGHDR